jgi:hypothetical protein
MKQDCGSYYSTIRGLAMKYGEIRWKVEKVVFQIDGGVLKRKSEVDEGRTLVRDASTQPDLSVCRGASSSRSA